MSDYLENNNEFETESVSAESTESTEGSYEWNTDSSEPQSTEYRYSYVNGNNEHADHNPNNYDNAYSSQQSYTTTDSDTSSNYSYSNQNQNTSYGNSTYQQYNGYGNQQTYNPYNQQQPYNSNANYQKPKKVKVKKEKKPASKGFVAAMLIISLLASGALGFGGGYIANNLNKTTNGSISINKVVANNTSSETSANNTSSIVKKSADSVVEIATESVVTGQFAQQYIQQGAGSGVIISEDGYIITNHHVIENANSVKVTLRDGNTSYNAAVIGSDKQNDIALLKVDAKNLPQATFGDSSNLAVGDYVVAIGNPLGQLGGTVTDGIISALARQVSIDNEHMTLLQTNAQISPGNSGGGLFNSNGELVGIVNAKNSATEVEGIGFAIPINNVLDIINDLKNYGYVTGKIDLGMQLTDITSNDTAFYYGLSRTGCYVISVTRGSNAENAGFRSGDLITKVNGTEVNSQSEVNAALEKSKVGDSVKFEIYRSGKTFDVTLKLAEYVPSGNSINNRVNGSQTATAPASNDDSDYDIWSQMFGW